MPWPKPPLLEDRSGVVAQVYRWGFLGATLHMVEILPLAMLLLGLLTLPGFSICVLNAITRPLTCRPYIYEG